VIFVFTIIKRIQDPLTANSELASGCFLPLNYFVAPKKARNSELLAWGL